MTRFLPLALAASLLSGCVTTDPDGKPVDNTPGLVIIGFVYTGEQRTAFGGCPLGRFGPFAGHYNLDFFKLDEKNQAVWWRRQMAYDGVCEAGETPSPGRYNVLELSPGRWRLDGLTNASLRPLLIIHNGPVIDLAPGEVVYVGDFTFDSLFVRTSLQGTTIKIQNTEAAARAALAARGYPAERMVVRPLEIVLRPNYR
ncbi:MAG: hypothetical protein ACK5XA_14820 [Tagaea sp.]